MRVKTLIGLRVVRSSKFGSNRDEKIASNRLKIGYVVVWGMRIEQVDVFSAGQKSYGFNPQKIPL